VTLGWAALPRHQGKLAFPWGHGVVFTQITRNQFETVGLAEAVDPNYVICSARTRRSAPRSIAPSLPFLPGILKQDAPQKTADVFEKVLLLQHAADSSEPCFVAHLLGDVA
jgi:hypothetical protein